MAFIIDIKHIDNSVLCSIVFVQKVGSAHVYIGLINVVFTHDGPVALGISIDQSVCTEQVSVRVGRYVNDVGHRRW